MNKRIDKLLVDAGAYFGGDGIVYDTFDPKKFTELIVQECIQVSEEHAKSLDAQPCETEFAEYENGVVEGIYEATAAIKEHFGVE